MQDDLYGIGPAMIVDLPIVRADNERMRKVIAEGEAKRLRALCQPVAGHDVQPEGIERD